MFYPKKFLFILCVPLFLQAASITGNFKSYLDVCEKTLQDPYYFENFRSLGEYRHILELPNGEPFYQYLLGTNPMLKAYFPMFEKLDTLGNPIVEEYPGVGRFSPTTLRYIVLADQMTKMFNLPPNPKIAEIGAGFGGQCYVISHLMPFSAYYIYDLPEVEGLIGKMMETLEVKNVHCIPIDDPLPEERIDLVISNYAYSECDREMQLAYFERVIKKADRGYLIYNQISKGDYNIDSLTPDEFVALLKGIGLRPKVFKEFLSTGHGNLLITWNKK